MKKIIRQPRIQVEIDVHGLMYDRIDSHIGFLKAMIKRPEEKRRHDEYRRDIEELKSLKSMLVKYESKLD